MEFCTSRHFLLSVFILQLVTLSTRQVFDFLGFMWTSVLVNFVCTLFIIFGVFGVIQSRSRYTISEQSIMSLGTGSISWWEMNGPGCKAIFLANKSTSEDPLELIKPDFVIGCIIEYQYIEVIQAAIQAVLALWGCITGIKVSHTFLIQDECRVDNSSKKNTCSLPLYSIEYNPRNNYNDDDSSRSGTEEMEHNAVLNGRRPMTPRRVKRRSIHSRGTLPISHLHQHQSHTFTHQPQQHHQQYIQDQPPPPYVRRPSYGSGRSYGRSSLPRRHRSASNQSLDQRHSTFHQDSSTSNDSCRIPAYSSHSQLLSPTDLLGQSASITNVAGGCSNPNFISSTSLDRPPSVRSSYSNFHGVRTFSYTNPNPATPQVPPNPYRRSTRNSTFFSNGPPAYEIQGCVDSETVI